MSLFRNFAIGLRSLFRKNQVDRELDEELGAYLEMEAAEKMRQGVTKLPRHSFALVAGNFLWTRIGRICALLLACYASLPALPPSLS